MRWQWSACLTCWNTKKCVCIRFSHFTILCCTPVWSLSTLCVCVCVLTGIIVTATYTELTVVIAVIVWYWRGTDGPQIQAHAGRTECFPALWPSALTRSGEGLFFFRSQLKMTEWCRLPVIVPLPSRTLTRPFKPSVGQLLLLQSSGVSVLWRHLRPGPARNKKKREWWLFFLLLTKSHRRLLIF